MKKILFIICGLFGLGITGVQAQNVRVNIANGTTVVGTGVSLSLSGFYSGSVANPSRFTVSPTASYIDTSAGGSLELYGPFWMDGTGTIKVSDFNTHNHYLSYTPSPLSVYNTVTINSGDTMDFNIGTPTTNNGLWVRSDLPGHSTANVVINGITYDYIMGLKVYPTATSGGCTSYTSALSLNASGTSLKYQWQNSNDSSTWSTVSGATTATYTATVTVTKYYRCVLTSIYSGTTGWLQNTPGVKLLFAVTPAAISGTLGVCMSSTTTLSNSVTGGVWTSGNTAVANIGSSSGIVSPVTSGTVTVTYSTGCAPDALATVTVNAVPTVSGGSNVAICNPSSTTLTATGGTTYAWTPSATLSASTGTSVTASPTVTTTYTVTGTTTGCSGTATVTVSVTTVPAITGTLTLLTGGNTTLSDATAGGVWTSVNTAVCTIGSSSGIVSGITAGTSVISYTIGSCSAVATVSVTSTSTIYYSNVGGGDASVLANWWTNNNNTGSHPGSFGVTGGAWIFQSAMTSTAAFSVADDVSIVTGGSFTPLSGSTTTVGGNWSNSGGTFTHNSGTVLFNGSNSAPADTLSGSMTGANAFNNLTFNSPANSYTFLGNPADVSGAFTQSSGAITAPSGNLRVAGNFNHTSGTFAPNGGTFIKEGTTSSINVSGMTTPGTNCFNNLSFNASSAATYSITADLVLTGNFTNLTSNATMDLGNHTITVGGNWANPGPVTTGAGSHVTFNGGTITVTGKL